MQAHMLVFVSTFTWICSCLIHLKRIRKQWNWINRKGRNLNRISGSSWSTQSCTWSFASSGITLQFSEPIVLYCGKTSLSVVACVVCAFSLLLLMWLWFLSIFCLNTVCIYRPQHHGKEVCDNSNWRRSPSRSNQTPWILWRPSFSTASCRQTVCCCFLECLVSQPEQCTGDALWEAKDVI